MADTYVNVGAEITSTQSAAVGALAAVTAGALPLKKSDGTYIDGPKHFIVADNYDPSVSGLIDPATSAPAVVGSVAVTITASAATAKVWIKYRSDVDTAWKAIHETREIYTAPAGGPFNTITVNVAVPEDRGVIVTAWAGVAPTADWTYMRFNGGYAVGAGGAMYSSTGVNSWSGFALFTSLTKTATMIMSISPSFGGVRTMRSTVATANTNTGTVEQAGSFTQGAITSIGIGVGSSPMLVAGSWIKARVLGKDEWS